MKQTLTLIGCLLLASTSLAGVDKIVNPADQPAQVSDAAFKAIAVTPNDAADLAAPYATRGLYVGVSGDVKVDVLGGGTGITFKAAPVGILRVQAKRVYATGTTATNIVALY